MKEENSKSTESNITTDSGLKKEDNSQFFDPLTYKPFSLIGTDDECYITLGVYRLVKGTKRECINTLKKNGYKLIVPVVEAYLHNKENNTKK